MIGEGEEFAANLAIAWSRDNPGQACDVWSNDSDAVLRLALAGAFNVSVVRELSGVLVRSSVFAIIKSLVETFLPETALSNTAVIDIAMPLTVMFLAVGDHDMKSPVRLGEPLEAFLAAYANRLHSTRFQISPTVSYY